MNNEEDKEDEKITRLREREGEAQRHKIKERAEEKRREIEKETDCGPHTTNERAK